MNFKSSKNKISISDLLLNSLVYISSLITFFVLIYIIFYIFSNGLKKINWNFISRKYSEGNTENGILPMIVNTIYTVVITILVSFPFGFGTALYTTQYSKNKLFNKIVSFSSDVLSGIPSIIFGIIGYSIFCVNFGFGTSILSGCLTMALCILPTIIRTSEEALRKVPNDYKEAALSLGAKDLRILFTVTVRTSIPEVLSAFSLYIGKILGESAIFIYTIGMGYMMPKNIFSHIFSSGRTLTLHLYQIAKQANTSDSLEVTFAVSSILIFIIFLINILINKLSNRIRNK